MSINLYTISDKLYALTELKSDHLFKKIPKERIDYYIKSSMDIGKKAAEEIKEKYGSKTINLKDVCNSRNISINIIDKEYRVGNISFRAEVRFKQRQINIIKASVMQLSEALKDRLSYDEIVDVHIAHELYHFLENDQLGNTGENLDKIKVFKLGPYTKMATVVKTSEISAHSFCKELLGLSFHPKALDYEYMLNEKTIEECELVKYFNHMEKELEYAE